jgi:hypothetical protein
MKPSRLAEAARRPPRPGPPLPFDAAGNVACPQCGASAPWASLAPVGLLEGEALALHLAVPPDGWFVDVRACGACGVSFARKVRASDGRRA